LSAAAPNDGQRSQSDETNSAENSAANSASPPATASDRDRSAYWRANLRWVLGLLTIWFAVSFGAAIIFAPQLNKVHLPGTGFPLGFWFAQQGSIIVFVLLILVYVRVMNRLDRQYRVAEDSTVDQADRDRQDTHDGEKR